MNAARRALPFAIAAALVGGTLFAAPSVTPELDPPFPHERHAKMFPLCSTCHAGVVERGEAVFPAPASCQSCHDGVVKPRVEWAPRSGPRPGNVKFTHDAHHRVAVAKTPADSAMATDCASCHTPADAHRMTVQVAVIPKCFSCHGIAAPHFDAPPATCATCHVRLTEARALTPAQVARFPKPRSHDDPDFLLAGHGRDARVSGARSGPGAIAASCATCHARNLCLSCHVNAPESPAIMALALDDRSPVRVSSRGVPPGHLSPDFMRTHGREADRRSATCATCHTRESCASCHVGSVPGSVAALPPAAEGRAPGVHVTRAPPPDHTREFRERHGAEANARPASCETCHTRPSCLQCHRPEPGRKPGYHPPSFLTLHPSSAYSRDASCSDCHNPAQFCQSCHQKSGLVAQSRLGTRGYHDAFRGFSLGHGQAARQSLETCASCHAERDCTACHSAVGGGFRFNPHGPGFNAERMRSKNPSVCAACHGGAVPRAP